MKTHFFVPPCIFLVFALNCFSADVSHEEHRPFTMDEAPDVSKFDLFELTIHTVENRLDRNFYNRFRPSRVAQISLALDGNIERAHDRISGRALSTLKSSVSKSAQEIFVQTPMYFAIDDWFRDHASFARNFFRDSMTGIDEQEMQTLDTTISEAEENWFSRLKRVHRIRYGIPPRQNPYAFVSGRVSYQKQTIAIVSGRYGISGLDEQKIEGRASFPVYDRTSLNFGFIYGITSPEKTRAVVGLSTRTKSGILTSVGVVLKDHPRLVAESTFTW